MSDDRGNLRIRQVVKLGRALLTGEGPDAPDPLRGLGLLREAARTEGDAAALLAYAHALGVCMPRDVPGGLDLLQQAAELGWTPAQQELRLLARRGGADWAALRRAINVRDLTAAPPRRPLAETPRLRVFEGFLTPAECDWLIARLAGQFQRAQIYTNAAGLATSPTRTNSEANFLMGAMDMVAALIRERIASAVRIAPEYFEVAKILHYEPGQSFSRHIDYFEPRTPALADEVRRNGQRVATLLIYLNDDYDGGETEFVDVGVRYRGRKGDALLFANVDVLGNPDTKSAHAGAPTTRGEKWVFSQWIRSQPVNAFMTSGVATEPLDPEWARSV